MKEFRCVILPSAKGDITACHDYLHERNVDAAQRFVDAVQETCSIIAVSPLAYPVMQPPKRGKPMPVALRKRTVKSFEKYLIFYHVTDDKVHIIRVLHGARDVSSILFGWS
jgi:toxin ParE1/3/4